MEVEKTAEQSQEQSLTQTSMTSLVETAKRLREIKAEANGEIAQPKKINLSSELLEIEYVTCPDCRKEWAALMPSGICYDCQKDQEFRQSENRRRQEKLEAILGPKAVKEFTFKSFQADLQTAEVLRQCVTFNPETENLYLYGPCGSGKTHLACAIVQEQFAKGLKAEVFKPPELMRRFRGVEASEESHELNRIAMVEVLLIDDLGVGKSTEFANQILYEIIDKRIMSYQNGLILTSNLSLKDFAIKAGDDRLPSRIAGLCKIVKVEAEDWRLKKQDGR